jgi:hypothetical protein
MTRAPTSPEGFVRIRGGRTSQSPASAGPRTEQKGCESVAGPVLAETKLPTRKPGRTIVATKQAFTIKCNDPAFDGFPQTHESAWPWSSNG